MDNNFLTSQKKLASDTINTYLKRRLQKQQKKKLTRLLLRIQNNQWPLT